MPLELIVGAAVGAAAASPSIRKAVRRGMIVGLGGLLVAYDKVATLAHDAAQGARKGLAQASAENTPQPGASAPATPAAETSAGQQTAAPAAAPST
jgi:hypothetical protein